MPLLIKILSLGFLLPVPVLAGADLGKFVLHHIGNKETWTPFPGQWSRMELPAHWQIGPVNMGLSLHVLMLFIAAALMLLFLLPARRRSHLLPAGRVGHMTEMLILYFRDEMVLPSIGKKDTATWLPFFLTLFFFVLFMNLVGLIPGFVPPTSNINVTGALSLIILFCYIPLDIARHGPVRYLTDLVPKGVPWPIVIILFPIELISQFSRALTLCLRLFANLSAGHIMILALLGLLSVFQMHPLVAWGVLVPVDLSFTLFIYGMEVLVALLQAYVFALLSILYVGMAIHHQH